MELFRQAQFATLDLMLRAHGHALGAIGFDPAELTHRILASGAHWRLRDYGGAEASLLIVAAPIKRPYIWGYGAKPQCHPIFLNHGVRVYLLEWIAPTASGGHVGLDECARAISECVARIATEPKTTKPFLIGHSLGGTLAAAFCACEPRAVRGLLLLGAPLCFQPATNRFRDALVSMIPPDLSEADIIPGSLLSHASAFASPDTFVWSRWMDAVLSLGDLRALDVHARVERWALDEAPLPGSWSIRLQNGCIGKTGSAEAISPCWVTRSAPHVSTFRRSRSSIRQTTLHRSPLLNLSLMRCLPRTLRPSNTPAKSALHAAPRNFLGAGRLTCMSGRRLSLGWRRIAQVRRQTNADIGKRVVLVSRPRIGVKTRRTQGKQIWSAMPHGADVNRRGVNAGGPERPALDL